MLNKIKNFLTLTIKSNKNVLIEEMLWFFLTVFQVFYKKVIFLIFKVSLRLKKIQLNFLSYLIILIINVLIND